MKTAAIRILRPLGIANAAAVETKFSNNWKTRRNPYPKGPGGVLSNEQKARLCMLSRQAFAVVHGRDPATTAEADAFRHAEVEKATGKHGLTLCVQGDYKTIEAWLLDLAGMSGAAFEAQLAQGTEAKRLALYKLDEACKAAEKTLAYAAAICRSKHKCALGDATSNQIWKLVFEMKKRAVKQPKTTAEEPF